MRVIRSWQPSILRQALAAACAGVLVVAAAASTAATSAGNRASADATARAEAEARRRDLIDRIERVRREIGEAEKARAAAADALKASEQAISDITRKLGEIEARRNDASRELAQLERQIQDVDADLQRRQRDLASLLRQQYMNGAGTPWSALLAGEDPQETGRTLGYLGYVSRARAEAVQELRARKQQLQELREQAAARRAELDALAQEHTAQRQERLKQQAERQRILKEIGERIAAQRREAASLEDDEARLTALISEINRALAERAAARQRAQAEARRRAEDEARRRAQQEAAARTAAERAAAERAAAEQARRLVEALPPSPAPPEPDASAGARSGFRLRTPGPPAPLPDPADTQRETQSAAAEQPGRVATAEAAPSSPGPQVFLDGAPVGGPTEPAPVTTAPLPRETPGEPATAAVARVVPRAIEPASPASAPRRAEPLQAEQARVNFAALRGRLGLPVEGEVQGRFGAQRPEGGSWRGVFIQAPASSPVRAVAPGEVVFSGWMRGFGNLLILDHGNEYLTVYANNEAILKQVGERVATGETVALAGSSGGQSQTGIYFEVRHRGNPVDPLEWVRAR